MKFEEVFSHDVEPGCWCDWLANVENHVVGKC